MPDALSTHTFITSDALGMERSSRSLLLVTLLLLANARCSLLIEDASDRALLATMLDAAREGDSRRLQNILATPRVATRMINQADESQGYSATHWAAYGGHVAALQTLLLFSPDVNLRTKVLGMTPLMFASDRGFVHCAKLLLQAGAHPNAATQHRLQTSGTVSGTTSLMFAASQGHSAVLDVLLFTGAHSHFRDEAGSNASDYARRGGHVELAKVMDEVSAQQLRPATPHFDFAGLIWQLATPSVVLGVFLNFVGMGTFLPLSRSNVQRR